MIIGNDEHMSAKELLQSPDIVVDCVDIRRHTLIIEGHRQSLQVLFASLQNIYKMYTVIK